MISSRVNITSEPDVENIQPQENKNESADKQLHMKCPMNAYLLWACHQRRKVYLDLSYIESKEILGAEWRQLTAEKKQPFVKDASSIEEQYMTDHSDYKHRFCMKPKTVVKSFDKAVVPGRMLSFSSSTLNAQECMPKLPVSAHDIGYKSDILSPCIPTDHTYFSNYHAKSNDSNTQCAASRMSNLIAAHNAEIQMESPRQYKIFCLDGKDTRQDLNRRDFVHNITSNPCLVQHRFLDPQQGTEESPLDLSLRKNP